MKVEAVISYFKAHTLTKKHKGNKLRIANPGQIFTSP
jgi:hypothetical protein